MSFPTLGTRIDYTLVTSGLLPWFQSADIQPDVMGSDHCPIFADLREEVTLGDGTSRRLRDELTTSVCADGCPRSYPALCARYYDEFSSKQQKLSGWFVKAGDSITQVKGSGDS